MRVAISHLPFGGRLWAEFRGLDTLQNALRDMATHIEDNRDVLKEVANVMRRSFATNFRMGGRPRWRPLAKSTVIGKKNNERFVYNDRSRRARVRRLEMARAEGSGMFARGAHNILIMSGAYRDSFATKSADHVEQISKERLNIGSKHWLVDIHEFGTGTYRQGRSPYTIRPVRAKALRFIGPNGGYRFAKSVQHPGVPARPVLILQQEDEDRIMEIMRRNADTGEQ